MSADRGPAVPRSPSLYPFLYSSHSRHCSIILSLDEHKVLTNFMFWETTDIRTINISFFDRALPLNAKGRIPPEHKSRRLPFLVAILKWRFQRNGMSCDGPSAQSAGCLTMIKEGIWEGILVEKIDVRGLCCKKMQVAETSQSAFSDSWYHKYKSCWIFHDGRGSDLIRSIKIKC